MSSSGKPVLRDFRMSHRPTNTNKELPTISANIQLPNFAAPRPSSKAYQSRFKRFWSQCFVLMWKNYLIRRRRPWFLVAEIVVSILIPLIFVIIRTTSPIESKPPCHIQTISLPTMGLFSYVQSMLCNFLYRCQSSPPTPFSVGQTTDKFMPFVNNLTEFLQDPITRTLFQMNHDSNSNFAESERIDFIGKAGQTILALQDLMKTTLYSEDEYASVEESKVFNIGLMNLTGKQLNQIIRLSILICGKSPQQNDIEYLVSYLTSGEYQQLLDQGKALIRTKRQTEKLVQINCFRIMQLLSDPLLFEYTKRLSFFLYGVVAYYPKTEWTEEIIKRASIHQRLLIHLKEILRHYSTYTSEKLHNLLNRFKLTIQSLNGINLCTQIFDRELKIWCQNLFQLVNPNDQQSIVTEIKQWLDQIDFIVDIFRQLLDCIHLDFKFVGFNDLNEFNQFIDIYYPFMQPIVMGLIFDKPNQTHEDGSFTSIRIRQNPYHMDTTRNFRVLDRIWTPKPRNNPSDKDVRYLTSGFLDQQDLLGTAIIDLESGRPDRLEDVENTSQSLPNSIVTGREMQFFPTPCYNFDRFIDQFIQLLPQVLLFSWIVTAMLTTKFLVEEKEHRLKEFSKIMGLSNCSHWCSWFLTQISITLIPCLIVTLALKFGYIIWMVDYWLLFVLLFSHVISIISFSFLCSVCFNQANLGAIVTGLFYFIFYLPAPMIIINEESITMPVYIASCLSNQVAFSLSFFTVCRMETQGIGAKWSDFWQPRYMDGIFSIGKSMCMLWTDTILYFFLALYIEAVWPGKYGVARPFYFPFTRQYWFGLKNRQVEHDLADQLSNKHTLDPNLFEQEPVENLVGIAIRNLTKVYKNNTKPALDRLTIDFYSNQVTSFLGHNGAGKSTLISILTGIYAPTSGTALICGYDIQTQMDLARANLGFCPQHNVLYDYLTVAEHIQFYASLRGLPRDQIRSEIDRFVQVLGFSSKRNQLSMKLSGGQKRKLSVAIAFVGGSSVIFLDEPTAGVDPYSRRSIWDLVMDLKLGKTIILTTHHMDEADILGDRIAIISQGHLKCYGSSLFLKSRHGEGYYLIFELKGHDDFDSNSENTTSIDQIKPMDLDRLMNFVTTYIPRAKYISSTSSEVLIQLPSEDALQGNFSKLFNELENDQQGKFNDLKEQLGILSYGLSDTTLEEVFISIADDPSQLETPNESESGLAKQMCLDENQSDKTLDSTYFKHRQSQIDSLRTSHKYTRFTDDGKLPVPSTRHSLVNRKHVHRKQHSNHHKHPKQTVVEDLDFMLASSSTQSNPSQQLRAMFVKRFHYFKRSKLGWLIELILPVIVLILSLTFTVIFTKRVGSTAMPIHPWLMANIISKPKLNTFYENNLATGKNASPVEQSIRQVELHYSEALNKPYGWTGARCLPPNIYQIVPKEYSSCQDPDQTSPWLPKPYLNEAELQTARFCDQIQCSCSTGSQQCPARSIEPKSPPHKQLVTTDWLYNLTGYNVSDYLLKSHNQFIMQRYGGLSFMASKNADLRIQLENILSPDSVIVRILSQWTGSYNSQTKQLQFDPFWPQMAEFLRHSLPPTHKQRIWFNNKGYASGPAYLAQLQNMQLRMTTMNKKSLYTRNSQTGLVFYLDPLTDPQKSHKTPSTREMLFDITVSIFSILALSFIPASFVTFLVRERHSGSKHLQLVSGLNPNIYWVGAYLWDIVNYILSALICVLVFVAFQKEAYVGLDVISSFIIVILLYGLAIIPLLYPFSFVIESPSTALVVLSVLNLLIGMVTIIGTFVLDLMSKDDRNLIQISKIFKIVFLIFPQFCFGQSLFELSLRLFTKQNYKTLVTLTKIRPELNPFSWSILGDKMCSLCIQACLFFLFTLALERKFLMGPIRMYFHKICPKFNETARRKFKQKLQRVEPDLAVTDQDVLEEQKRVQQVSQAQAQSV